MRIELKFSNLPNNQEVIWDQESNRITIQTIQAESGYDEAQSSGSALSGSSEYLMKILDNALVIESECLENGKFLKIILNTAIHEVFFVETATGKTLSFNSLEVLIHGSQVNINPIEREDFYEESESDYRAMVPLEHFFIEFKEEDSRVHDFSSHKKSTQHSLNSTTSNTSREPSLDLSESFVNDSLPHIVDKELQGQIDKAITNIKRLKISETVYSNFAEDIGYLFNLDQPKFSGYLSKIQECPTVPHMMQLLELFKKESSELYRALEAPGNPERDHNYYHRELINKLNKSQADALIERLSENLDPGVELKEIQKLITNYAQQGGDISALSKSLYGLIDPSQILEIIETHLESVFTGEFYRFGLNDLE